MTDRNPLCPIWRTERCLEALFGRSLRDGLGGAEAPEPPARLGASRAIPNAENDK